MTTHLHNNPGADRESIRPDLESNLTAGPAAGQTAHLLVLCSETDACSVGLSLLPEQQRQPRTGNSLLSPLM